MRSTLLKATAALMVTLVAWTTQAAPQGPTFTNLVIQGFLKNNLGTAINGSLTTVTMTVNQNGSPIASFAANQTLVVSNGAYSHSLTIPADAFYNGGAGAVTVAVSVPAQTLTNSQTLSFTLNSATVPTAFVAERVAPVNTTDTTIGGSIAVGKVVVLGQDGKLPAVDGGNITNISGSVISGSISSATVPASQLTSGSFPVGVSIPASQITAGALPSGISILPTSLSGGTIPSSVMVLPASISVGTLPVGVSLPLGNLVAGTLPSNVSVPLANLDAGTLPSNVSLPLASLVAGTLPANVSVLPTNMSIGTLPTHVSVPDANIYPSVQALTQGAGNITTANGARVIMLTTSANVSVTTINGCNSGLYAQGSILTLIVAGGSGAHSVAFVDTPVATATADSIVVLAAANYATAATANGTARGSTYQIMCTTLVGTRKWVEISRSINSN